MSGRCWCSPALGSRASSKKPLAIRGLQEPRVCRRPGECRDPPWGGFARTLGRVVGNGGVASYAWGGWVSGLESNGISSSRSSVKSSRVPVDARGSGGASCLEGGARAGSCSVGVGVAPPLGFQFATLQISSMPVVLGLPSLFSRPSSSACSVSHFARACFGDLPLNREGSDVTAVQALIAASSLSGPLRMVRPQVAKLPQATSIEDFADYPPCS